MRKIIVVLTLAAAALLAGCSGGHTAVKTAAPAGGAARLPSLQQVICGFKDAGMTQAQVVTATFEAPEKVAQVRAIIAADWRSC